MPVNVRTISYLNDKPLYNAFTYWHNLNGDLDTHVIQQKFSLWLKDTYNLDWNIADTEHVVSGNDEDWVRFVLEWV